MREGHPRVWRCAMALVLLASPAAWALNGAVVDEKGQPLPLVTVCYYEDRVEVLCTVSDSDGNFNLEDRDIERIRLRKRGYLTRILAAVRQPRAIDMQPAATLRLQLSGVDGTAIDEATIHLVRSDGRQLGPFPYGTGGLTVRTLPPGLYRARVDADGWTQGSSPTLQLTGGETLEETLLLKRVD